MKPTEAYHSIVGTDGQVHVGVSIRDYVAIEAMKALMINSEVLIISHLDGEGDAERIAKMAYKYADALLVESGRKDESEQFNRDFAVHEATSKLQ